VGRIVNGRSAQRSLGSIVLGFESIVVLLGALVLFGLRRLDPVVALVGGGALFVVVLVTIGLLRFRWAFAIGWLVQAVVLAAGFLEPTFFVVGAIFAGMWAYCMVTGARLDRLNREHAARDEVPHDETTGAGDAGPGAEPHDNPEPEGKAE